MLDLIQTGIPVLDTALTVVPSVLGSLVLVGRGLQGIAKFTPTKKDDAVLDKAVNKLEGLGLLIAKLGALGSTPKR